MHSMCHFIVYFANLVSLCRHAALYYLTYPRLFCSSIQKNSLHCVGGFDFGLHRIHIDCICEQQHIAFVCYRKRKWKKKQTKLKRDHFFHSKEPGYNEVYYSTHIRFPSWLIGFIVGYILLEYPKGSIHIPKVGFFNTRIPVRNNFYFYLSVCFRKRIFVHWHCH